jgi:hypothetical protein
VGPATTATLDVLRKLAVTLGVTTDTLVFEESERGPADTRFAIHLEWVSPRNVEASLMREADHGRVETEV